GHLLEIARSMTSRRASFAAGLPIVPRSPIERRLREILAAGRDRRPASRVVRAGLGGAALCLLVPLAAVRSSEMRQPAGDGMLSEALSLRAGEGREVNLSAELPREADTFVNQGPVAGFRGATLTLLDAGSLERPHPSDEACDEPEETQDQPKA